MTEKTNQITDDVIAIYNEHVEVILELKRTQWQITNYVTLLFVAMYALRSSMGGAAVPNLLLLVPVFVGLVGAYFIIVHHYGLTERRKQIWRARRLFSAKAIEAYGKDDREPGFFSKDFHVPLASLLITLAGTLICVFPLPHL